MDHVELSDPGREPFQRELCDVDLEGHVWEVGLLDVSEYAVDLVLLLYASLSATGLVERRVFAVG
jgi:hypothetical protein